MSFVVGAIKATPVTLDDESDKPKAFSNVLLLIIPPETLKTPFSNFAVASVVEFTQLMTVPSVSVVLNVFVDTVPSTVRVSICLLFIPRSSSVVPVVTASIIVCIPYTGFDDAYAPVNSDVNPNISLISLLALDEEDDVRVASVIISLDVAESNDA